MEGDHAGDRERRARKSPQDVDAVVGHGPFLVDGRVSGTGAWSVFRGGCQADMGDGWLSGCRVMGSLGPRDAPGRCMKSEQRTLMAYRHGSSPEHGCVPCVCLLFAQRSSCRRDLRSQTCTAVCTCFVVYSVTARWSRVPALKAQCSRPSAPRPPRSKSPAASDHASDSRAGASPGLSRAQPRRLRVSP